MKRVLIALGCFLGGLALLRGAPAKLEDTLELPAATPAAGATFAIFITGGRCPNLKSEFQTGKWAKSGSRFGSDTQHSPWRGE